MPYIDPTIRGGLDSEINNLVEAIYEMADHPDYDGVLNYVITTIVAKVMKPDDGWRYRYLTRAHSVFIMAAAEFYRRLVAPYEDLAIQKNGDVYDNV